MAANTFDGAPAIRDLSDLKYELAPEMTRFAQAMCVDGLRKPIDLDDRRPHGACLHEVCNPFHGLARSLHRWAQRNYVGPRRLGRFYSGRDEGSTTAGFKNFE